MNPQSLMTMGIIFVMFSAISWAHGTASSYETASFFGGVFAVGAGLGWLYAERPKGGD